MSTDTRRAQANIVCPKSKRTQQAKPNMLNSKMSLINPGTGTGALPLRLGSLGTANIPHSAATINGKIKAMTYFKDLSPKLHPQMPIETRAKISKISRNNRFNGCCPITLS